MREDKTFCDRCGKEIHVGTDDYGIQVCIEIYTNFRGKSSPDIGSVGRYLDICAVCCKYIPKVTDEITDMAVIMLLGNDL
jgi:hypothetical protein